jgi:biotin operon repressor
VRNFIYVTRLRKEMMMQDQSNLPSVKKVRQLFKDHFNEWLAIPQISRVCHLRDNTVQKCIFWIRKAGIDIEKSKRVYTGNDEYYYLYRMGPL